MTQEAQSFGDRLAIMEQCARYNLYADRAMSPEFVSLFTPDATLRVQIGDQTMAYAGHDQLRAFAHDLVPGATLHLTLDHITEVAGDSATHHCVVMLRRFSPRRSAFRWMTGRYEDQFVRTGGVWRFSMRVGFLDSTTEGLVPAVAPPLAADDERPDQ